MSHNPQLTSLDCCCNRLTALDLSANPALTSLDCSWNPLETLDLSRNTALTVLCCRESALTALELGDNAVLNVLDCSDCKLTVLDLSGNPGLTRLDCSFNELTSLNVGGNPALQYLDCRWNSLSLLDVSACPGLLTGAIWVDEGVVLLFEKPKDSVESEEPAGSCEHLWDGASPYRMSGETLWTLVCSKCGEQFRVDDEGLQEQRVLYRLAQGDPCLQEAQRIKAQGLSEYDTMAACARYAASRCTNNNCCWSDAANLEAMLRCCGLKAQTVTMSDWYARNNTQPADYYDENGAWLWPNGLGSNHAWNRCTLSDGTWYELDASYGFGTYEISQPNSWLH